MKAAFEILFVLAILGVPISVFSGLLFGIAAKLVGIGRALPADAGVAAPPAQPKEALTAS